MEALLRSVIEPLILNPEELEIRMDVRGHEVNLTVSANPDDVGRIIGRGGRRAQSIRSIMKAKGAMENKRVNVEILS
ncbi:MAG: KH domain-containing protein [Clostridiaceae bacterium]|jgi:predicted RNA-binding protein YlqC (UPF0109 family)|nr:KH domain-containing protein [Clostridiaceae bacterium]